MIHFTKPGTLSVAEIKAAMHMMENKIMLFLFGYMSTMIGMKHFKKYRDEKHPGT
jgi:hypothetical protein